jgi:hypothetical protein
VKFTPDGGWIDVRAGLAIATAEIAATLKLWTQSGRCRSFLKQTVVHRLG